MHRNTIGPKYRSAGALACHTRIRAGFPRDARMHQNTISPKSPSVVCDRLITNGYAAEHNQPEIP